MLELSKINKRKDLINLGYEEPKKNLDLLERSINDIYTLENYVSEWRTYDVYEVESLSNVLNIIETFLEKNNKKYIKDKIEDMIEYYIIPKISDRNSISIMNEFILDNGLQPLKLLSKINEMFTYDRIIRNQSKLDKVINVYNDFSDTVLEICNIYNESPLSINEKYALSLENSLYSYDKTKTKYYMNINRDDVIDNVNMYYELLYNESFDYNSINTINELGAFGGAIVAGTIAGMSINNMVPINVVLEKISKEKLEDYEDDNGLRPLVEVDLDKVKMINALAANDYCNPSRTEIRDIDIKGSKYKAIAFYENSSISKLSLLYTKGKSVVAVPIYAKLTEAQPTMIKYGVVRNLHETTMTDILFTENKKIKKSNKNKKNVSLKSTLRSIYTKNKDKANKCIPAMKKAISDFFANDERHIIDEIPSIFDVIRTSCAFLSLAINPYLGLVTYLTGLFLKMHFEREKADKVLKKYDNEIEKMEKKVQEAKNEKTKENYKKYLKELKTNRGKLYDHYDKYIDEEDDDDDFTFDESYIEPINELSLVSNLKLAQQSLKKGMQKLSDKEKKLSEKLDHAYDRFVYQVEKNMSNRNREAVIKGSVIPSFSALIKLGCTAGLASLVSPILSAITVMGGIAASKNATKKERQYILDEIEIQLKVIEKKLQLAETNNDMKSYEQLLKIQRQLQSEKNRIIYRKRRSVTATKYN